MQNYSFSWSVSFSLKLKCLLVGGQTERVFVIRCISWFYTLQWHTDFSYDTQFSLSFFHSELLYHSANAFYEEKIHCIFSKPYKLHLKNFIFQKQMVNMSL